MKKISVILLGIVFIGIVGFYGMQYWHKNTLSENAALCEKVADVLVQKSDSTIQKMGFDIWLSPSNLDELEVTALDVRLEDEFYHYLRNKKGIEGGFYLGGVEQFIGYSYPTSPPPAPVYGPPPRSFNIIKNQCEKTLTEGKEILNIHEFDPAYFPLVTIPVFYKNKAIGVVWVRKHIERDLPLVKLRSVVLVFLILVVVVLLIIIAFYRKMQRNITVIQNELQMVLSNPDYKIAYKGQMFSEIKNAINHTLTKLQEGNKKRAELESKLVQKEKMASIGRIVAGVAHEVRTPLAIIKTRIQIWQMLLRKGKLFDNNSDLFNDEAMKLVVNETDRLSDLIKRLLLFSKPVGAKYATNLNALVADVVKIIEIKKERNDIIFNVINSDIPMVMVDKSAIQQVLINIVSNAVEAMPNGGELNIKTAICENNTQVCITVTDEGEGISEKIKSKMFELFATSKPNGVGLGLPISYEIIKAHKGRIIYSDNNPKGTICSIYIPL